MTSIWHENAHDLTTIAIHVIQEFSIGYVFTLGVVIPSCHRETGWRSNVQINSKCHTSSIYTVAPWLVNKAFFFILDKPPDLGQPAPFTGKPARAGIPQLLIAILGEDMVGA